MKRILPTLVMSFLMLLPVAAHALDGFPAFPMAFWGNVTINGSAAPVGTVVRAYYGSTLAGSATVQQAGVYGYTEPTKQKLIAAEGAGAITFTIQASGSNGGVETGGTSSVTYSAFTSGSTIQKDLAFSIDSAALALATSTNPNGSLSATVPSATESSTTSGGITTTLDIPTGTVITGPSGWDGKLALPTATTNFTLTANSGNTASAVEAIEVGAGDTPLTFDKAVKLTFSGQAGKLIGWSQAGTFHQITATCDSATNPTLAAGADCKKDVGTDLIVWTKHFSTFIAYTETAIPAPVSSGGGGGGGGGGGIAYTYSVSINNGASTATSTSVTLTLAPAASANQMQISNAPDFATSTWLAFQSTYLWTLTPGAGAKTVYVRYGSNNSVVANAQNSVTLTGNTASPVVQVAQTQPIQPAKPQGQVLGASTYNFTVNLKGGSRGADVTALQQILIDGGYLSISAPTGTYGSLTASAVKKYQAAKGIEQTGTVGPKTRAALNAGVTPAMSDEQRSTLIAQLTAQVQSLLAQLKVLQAAKAASGQ